MTHKDLVGRYTNKSIKDQMKTEERCSKTVTIKSTVLRNYQTYYQLKTNITYLVPNSKLEEFKTSDFFKRIFE